MIFCQENSSDIKKYFHGSYVKFPMAGDTVHFVDKVDSNSVRGRVYQADESGELKEEAFCFYLYTNENGDQPDVQFIMPKKSYFNHKGNAYFLYRAPARQYHRGVTAENTVIRKLNGNGEFENVGLSFKMLNEYVGKQEFSKFRKIDAGSYAVSPRIAVAGYGSVYVDQVRVGSINHDEKTIVVPSLFVSEFTKLAQGTEYEVQGPVPVKRPKKQINPKGYVAKKIVVEEFNEVEEGQF